MRKKNYYRPYAGRRGASWKKVICILLLAGILCFGLLEGIIFAGAKDQINGEPEIMIVFGCKVESWGPSVLLQDRLDTALEYLEEHPDMTVIVTGGKGNDEHVSEAQAMYDYLTEKGVDGETIFMEDQSHNTWANLNYTLELLQDLSSSGEIERSGEYLLVSSGFHLTRIKMLWGRVWEGTYSLSTLAAPVSHVPSAVAMFFREPLALVKSFIFDH